MSVGYNIRVLTEFLHRFRIFEFIAQAIAMNSPAVEWPTLIAQMAVSLIVIAVQ